VARGKTLREGAGLVVLVPVERLGIDEAPGDRQTHRVDVGDEDDRAGQDLALGDDAELRRRLHAVDEIGPGIGEGDHLGAGRLRLRLHEAVEQSERGKTDGKQRCFCGQVDAMPRWSFSCHCMPKFCAAVTCNEALALLVLRP